MIFFRTPRRYHAIASALPLSVLVGSGLLLASTVAAQAQDGAPAPAEAVGDDPNAQTTAPAPANETPSYIAGDDGGDTDILSRRTLSVLLDARLVLADGPASWIDSGLGKTRFGGTADGGFKARAIPVEAAVIWTPRFTKSLSANVSGAWQRGQQHGFDLIEGFVTYAPERGNGIGVSARAGLMWPEISLEHATGGAWSVVNTITPSAINSWVGEEVKVLGLEGTVHASVGEQDFSLTAAAFGFNDTSATLLSFRGWAMHDIKATGFGHLPLPPRNAFMTRAQEGRTRSALEIDDRVGFYGRAEWRSSGPLGASLFYYDNRGNPEAVDAALQWGWRTRFWNLGITADLTANTRLLMQGMTGTTLMGFKRNGIDWVDTRFTSLFALVTHNLSDATAISGRVEAFETKERGSVMERANSEDGWALTAAVRRTVSPRATVFLEALHVASNRGVRPALVGQPAREGQTVMQASLRFRL